MTEEKLTRKQKREINKATWRELSREARALSKKEREEVIKEIRNCDLDWRDKYLEALQMGLSIAEAASASKKGLNYIYAERRSNEEFDNEHTRAREISNDLKAEAIEAMNEETPREGIDAQGNRFYDKTELQWRKAKEDSAKWLLSVRDPKRFGTQRVSAELTGKDGADLNTAKMFVVTQEELDKAAEKIRRESQ